MVQDRAYAFHRRLVDRGLRQGVHRPHHRQADPAQGGRLDRAGHRHRIGDPAAEFGVEQAEHLGRAGDRQALEHHRRDLDRFGPGKVGQLRRRQRGDPVPRVGRARQRRHPPQSARRVMGQVRAQDVERAVDGAGKGQPHRFQPVAELVHHRVARVAVDQVHRRHVLRQPRLRLDRQRGQLQIRPLGQHQPHDHRRLLARGQRRRDADRHRHARGHPRPQPCGHCVHHHRPAPDSLSRATMAGPD